MGVYYDKNKKYYYYQFFLQKDNIRKAYKGRGFATKKECEREERRRYLDLENTLEIKEDNTFDYYLSLFLEKKKSVSKLSTHACLVTAVNKYIIPVFKGVKMKNINIEMIRKWKNKVIQHDLSENRTNKIINAMKNILNEAVYSNELSPNVPKELTLIKKDTVKSKNEIWSVEEFDKFINTFDNSDKYKLFFTVLFYSGMRIAEIRALKGNDIINTSISVNKTATSKLGIKDYISTPKTKTSVRLISMPDSIIEKIKLLNINKNSFIFSNDGSSPFGETNIRRSLNKHILIAGVKKIRIHDFRHSHASHLINNGIPIKAVSQRLGHSSVKITMDTYWHLLDSTDDAIINLIEKRA